jgi:hypothetical protein
MPPRDAEAVVVVDVFRVKTRPRRFRVEDEYARRQTSLYSE